MESAFGKLTQQTHPDLTHQNWTYNSTTTPYYVATKTDENGNLTTFTRDPTTHLVTRIDYQGGAYETFTYNSFSQVTDHQLASGAHETAVYDATGLKKSSTDSVTNETTKYTYDSFNRLQTVKDPRAIALGLPYSEKYEYNGRNQITAIPIVRRPVVLPIQWCPMATMAAVGARASRTNWVTRAQSSTTITVESLVILSR